MVAFLAVAAFEAALAVGLGTRVPGFHAERSILGVDPGFGRDCAVAFPPPCSSTQKKYYAFARRHGLGPLVCCGWTQSKRVWHLSSNAIAPKGFADPEQASQYSFGLFSSYAVEIRRE